MCRLAYRSLRSPLFALIAPMAVTPSFRMPAAKVASVSVGLVTVLIWLIGTDGATARPQRTAEQDRQDLIALENTWLKGEHDAAVLDSILASDFVHPIPTGDFLTKGQHISYSSGAPAACQFE